MCSIHEYPAHALRGRLDMRAAGRLLGAAILAAAFLAAGCQSRPFADLARRSAQQPLVAETEPSQQTPMQKEAPRIEPQTPPAAETQTPAPPVAAESAEAPAVLQRPWPVSVAYRPSGDVDAGNTYWPTIDESRPRPEWVSGIMEGWEFLFNLAAAPVRLFITRPAPWGGMIYSPIGPAGEEHED